MDFNNKRFQKLSTSKKNSKRNLITSLKMQEIPLKYPLQKRNTIKEENQNTGSPPQVKIKKPNPIKKNKTIQSIFHLSETIVKTVISDNVRKR